MSAEWGRGAGTSCIPVVQLGFVDDETEALEASLVPDFARRDHLQARRGERGAEWGAELWGHAR